MDTFAHYEFEELYKEEENKKCFDCGNLIEQKFKRLYEKKDNYL